MATYQTRSGKVRAIIRRKGFDPVSRTFPTKTAARVWAERTERDLATHEAHGRAEGDRDTVAQLFDWYEVYVRKLKTISVTQRGNLTRLREGLGHKIASKLTAGDVIEHTKARRTGEHITSKGILIPACGGATMGVELTYLSAVLKLAASVGKITMLQDPVLLARPTLRMLKLIAKPNKRERRPTQDEINRLLDHFDRNAYRMKLPMRAIVEFAIGTAKRQGEITRLLRSDLDAEKRIGLLRNAKHPQKKEGNDRLFPLLGEMWPLVEKQTNSGVDDLIFPYNSKSVGTAFTRACRALNIDDLRFHDLRHEATSRLFEQGYSIEQVAMVTLHESWSELKRYTQIKPESLHIKPRG